MSSKRPRQNGSSLMALGKRSTRAISRAVAFSGLMTMDRPSSARMKRSWRSYSGLRMRAMVWRVPIFLATRQARMLISSLDYTYIY